MEILFSHTPSHLDISQAIIWDKSIMEWAIGREGGRQKEFLIQVIVVVRIFICP